MRNVFAFVLATASTPVLVAAQRHPLESPALTRIEHAPTGNRWRRDSVTKEEKSYAVNGKITFVPASGTFEVSWDGQNGKRQFSLFDPPNRLSATVTADVTFNPSAGLYTYRYEVANVRSSKQTLRSIYVDAEGVVRSAGPNASWYSRKVTPFLKTRFGMAEGWAWSNVRESGVDPGKTAPGFEIVSRFAPSPRNVYVAGRQERSDDKEDMPEELMAALQHPSYAFPKGLTLAPAPFSDTLVASVIVDTVMANFALASTQGWAGKNQTAKELLNRLSTLKSQVVAGNGREADETIRLLLSDLAQGRYPDMLSEGRAYLSFRLPLVQRAIQRAR